MNNSNLHIKKTYDLIFVGRLAPEKRLDVLIDIAVYARRMRNPVRIAIVGDGPLRSWLLRTMRTHHLNNSIFYLGNSKHPTDIIRKSKLLILPSENESHSLVVLEASAQGVPSIISNFLGASEVVEEGKTGWVIKSYYDFPQRVLTILKKNISILQAGKAAKIRLYQKYKNRNKTVYVNQIMGITNNINKDRFIHLIILHWDLGIGGIQQIIYDVIQKTHQMGANAKITILLKRAEPHFVKLPKNWNVQIFSYSNRLYKGDSMKFFFWILIRIMSSNPTHILSFMDKLSFVAAIAKTFFFLIGRRVRFVISQDVCLSTYVMMNNSWAWTYIDRITYSVTTKIVTRTSALKDDLINNFRIADHKIKVIPPWPPQV